MNVNNNPLAKWIIVTIVVIATFAINSLITKLVGNKYEDSDIRSYIEKFTYDDYPKNISDNICIVETDSISRQEISLLLDKLVSYEPAVIGLDITFDHKSDSKSDSLLISSIKRCGNKIVVPLKGDDYDEESASYDKIFTPFFNDSIPDTPKGFVNFIEGIQRPIIIRCKYAIKDIPSFSCAIANAFNTYSGNAKNYFTMEDDFLIKYGKVVFPSFTARNIINETIKKNELKGKVVVIGDVDNPQDRLTTIVGTMAGTKVQAYSINTLISDAYNSKLKNVWIVIITLIIALVFAWTMIWGNYSLGDLGGIFIRAIQIALCVIMFVVGTVFLGKYNITLNWFMPLATVATEAVVYDIVVGLIYIFNRLKQHQLRT